MKKELLKLLSCPNCLNKVTLEGGVWEGEEILSGQLSCRQQHRFPIEDGIPRFVGRIAAMECRTQKVFGEEWTTFAQYDASNLAAMAEDLSADFFSGRLVLDAGCGGGRHCEELKIVWGAETVIGTDLSEAVLTAFERTKEKVGIHIVHASIYALPFQRNFFDVVFCLGVLQHVPDPYRGFAALMECLKPGGRIAIWVYKKSLRKQILEIPRIITKRLPLSVQRVVSLVAATSFYPAVLATRYLHFPMPSHFREYAKHNWLTYRTDWFDRLSAPLTAYYDKDEIHNWLCKQPLEKIQVSSYGDFFVRGIGVKIQP